jgi:hypothetical protein
MAPYGGTRVLYGRRLPGFGSLTSNRSAALWAGARVKEQQSQNYRNKDRPRNPNPVREKYKHSASQLRVAEIVPNWENSRSRTRGCRNRFDETIRLRSDRRIIFIAPALRSMQPPRGGNARSRGLFAVQDEHHRRRSATEREAPLGVLGQTSKARPAHAGLCDYRRWTRRSDRRDLSGAVPARGGPG